MQVIQDKIRKLLKKAKEEQDNAEPGSHDAQQGINYTVKSHGVFPIFDYYICDWI